MEQKKNNLNILYTVIFKKIKKHLMRNGKSLKSKNHLITYIYNLKKTQAISIFFIYLYILNINTIVNIKKKKNNIKIISLDKQKQINFAIKKIKILKDLNTKNILHKQTVYTELEKNKYTIK